MSAVGVFKNRSRLGKNGAAGVVGKGLASQCAKLKTFETSGIARDTRRKRAF